jgi:hypothetical protein
VDAVCSISANHQTPSLKIVPPGTSTIPILQGDATKTLPPVIGRTTKGFYFLWLNNLKFSENNLKYPWDKNADNRTKSL